MIPIPPAISATLSLVRAASVKVPNGPSATTRVPGLIEPTRAREVPEVLHRDAERLAVGRLGERERVCGPPASGCEEAPEEELPGLCAQAVDVGAADAQGRHARPLGDDLDDAQPVAEGAHERDDDAVAHEQRQRRDVERAPVVRGRLGDDELVAGRDLVEPRERDACVCEQVDGVPPLVAQAPAHDHERRHDDRDHQRGADRRRDHPGVEAVSEHAGELLRQRQAVEQCVAVDREDDVSEDEVERRVAVPAMPRRQPVEAEQPLEHRQPREQHDLDQREVCPEQAGDAADAREQVGRRPRMGIAAVPPEPDDHGRVPRHDQPDERDGGAARQARNARPPRRQRLDDGRLAHPVPTGKHGFLGAAYDGG